MYIDIVLKNIELALNKEINTSYILFLFSSEFKVPNFQFCFSNYVLQL